MVPDNPNAIWGLSLESFLSLETPGHLKNSRKQSPNIKKELSFQNYKFRNSNNENLRKRQAPNNDEDPSKQLVNIGYDIDIYQKHEMDIL